MKYILNYGLAMSIVLGIAVASCVNTPVNPDDWEWPEPPADSTEIRDSTITDPMDTTDTPDIPEIPDDPADGKGVILIVGGGASGCSAGIQAARMGMETIIVEESPWLGGMLTSAGVTATDGCYYLRGGLFAEFTDALAKHYGSYNALKTGWVSNILYEPHIGEEIFERLCDAEENLTVVKNTRFESLSKKAKGWTVCFTDKDGKAVSYDCDLLIDATELGDVAKAAGVRYRLGMDSSADTGESAAIGPNDIVQDLTMVMTLKNYGKDMSIEMPEGYDESLYVNCCKNSLNVPSNTGQTLWEPSMMMSYGCCPGGKWMINWPISGNDYYTNLVDLSREEREKEIEKAKQHSLGFLYFIQTRLGYNTYYLADDEYPTEDLFPFIPYHRESRRIYGEHLFTVDEAASTFSTDAYRTGIAVGDYPVDHHHFALKNWYDYKIDFPKIIPFSLPLGCLVPLEVEDLIVAEKSVSVSNLINGSTRLQPVVMELGQAAGAMAVSALRHECAVREVSIREVQLSLLESGALMLPYRDCLGSHTDFVAVHKIGLTGILRGDGKTVGWSNECNFKPTVALCWKDLFLEDYYGIAYNESSAYVTGAEFLQLLESICGKAIEDFPDCNAPMITRAKAARYIDRYLDPFSRPVDWHGTLK